MASGESGIRTHAPLRTNGFQDRLVMTTSISLHMLLTAFVVFSPPTQGSSPGTGKGTDIVEEFRYIESQQHISVPLEELFLDLGERSQIEDIENFASVFYTAKRTGGDMNRVIQKVSRMLGDKIDVKKEIEATLAAKKSEQMIMSLMPVGIILYLQMTSPGFLSVLYGNPFGIAAMSICLVIYAAAYWLGRRIVDIEV